jgi:hypothetical protein
MWQLIQLCLTSVELQSFVTGDAHLKVSPRSNPFLAFALVLTTVEKPASQRYLGTGGIRSLRAVAENRLFWTSFSPKGHNAGRLFSVNLRARKGILLYLDFLDFDNFFIHCKQSPSSCFHVTLLYVQKVSTDRFCYQQQSDISLSYPKTGLPVLTTWIHTNFEVKLELVRKRATLSWAARIVTEFLLVTELIDWFQ